MSTAAVANYSNKKSINAAFHIQPSKFSKLLMPAILILAGLYLRLIKTRLFLSCGQFIGLIGF